MEKLNRVICLGDTHGRVKWKEIVAKEASADKIIFIGDLF
jgi:predicted phosphodiesterase